MTLAKRLIAIETRLERGEISNTEARLMMLFVFVLGALNEEADVESFCDENRKIINEGNLFFDSFTKDTLAIEANLTPAVVS